MRELPKGYKPVKVWTFADIVPPIEITALKKGNSYLVHNICYDQFDEYKIDVPTDSGDAIYSTRLTAIDSEIHRLHTLILTLEANR